MTTAATSAAAQEADAGSDYHTHSHTHTLTHSHAHSHAHTHARTHSLAALALWLGRATGDDAGRCKSTSRKEGNSHHTPLPLPHTCSLLIVLSVTLPPSPPPLALILTRSSFGATGTSLAHSETEEPFAFPPPASFPPASFPAFPTHSKSCVRSVTPPPTAPATRDRS